ncbi:ABC transporter permease [Pedobacter montanisoli]|uniref:ABC transporter permease n=1 Tax=Pedobacter montanisoli TaxID=2923277 RepID=A0ABS9ZX96_9SPHI|nr:ABC transporter permease [Pedobacter montanisoli]MCJ0742919.1 ABC transporter permease [Pedobacter montanisoli]
MFKLNLKIALRNLWKNKAYTAINILGLSLGLAGFMMILTYVNRETSYDKWNEKLYRTYRVGREEVQNGAESKGPKIKRLFAKMLNEQFHEVENVSVGHLESRRYLYGTEDISKPAERSVTVTVDSNFLKVYPLTPVKGSIIGFNTAPNAVAISLSCAKKYFGDEDPIGKTLIRKGGFNFKDENLVVKAVWDDQKQPSVFKFDVITKLDEKVYGDQLLGTSFSTLFTLRKNADHKQLFEKINNQYLIERAKLASKNSSAAFNPSIEEAKEILKKEEGITNHKVIIESVPDINLTSYYSSDNPKQKSIYILATLAGFLIFISCVNYTNMALVLAQSRAKEVGVKKVLGCFRADLTKQFLLETAVQCIGAFLIALMLVELFMPSVNLMINDNLKFFDGYNTLKVLQQSLLLLAGVIIIAGLYPALILSGYAPVKVLKGNLSTSKKIGAFRKVLIVSQFAIAASLAISFLVVYAQLQYMKNKDLGIEPKLLVNLGIADFKHRNLNPNEFESIKQRLLTIKGVEDVSRSVDMPINDSGFEDDIEFKGIKQKVDAKYTDPNYLSVVKGKIIAGRDFSAQKMSTDTLNSVIINQTLYNKLSLSDRLDQQLGIYVNDELKQFNVIGVVKDIQVYGFESKINPTIYMANDFKFHWRQNVLIRINGHNITETISDIKKTWRQIEPGDEPNINFIDEVAAKMNLSYEVSGRLIFLFGSLTLLVSLFGLLSIAAYSAKIRLKEIAVRRVLGASTGSLLKLLNKDLVKLVLMANIIADVLAYIYMDSWFRIFVYRIEMPFMLFLSVNLVSVLLAIAIVSMQSIRAVKADPVKMLKYE